MGYQVAIVPGLLLKAAIAACDDGAGGVGGHASASGRPTDMTVRQAFDRVGAQEWDALRTRFRDGAGEAE